MPLKDKFSKFRLKSSKTTDKNEQPQMTSELSQKPADLPPSTSTWKDISAKLMPSFRSRRHSTDLDGRTDSHGKEAKPATATLASSGPANNTPVSTSVMDPLPNQSGQKTPSSPPNRNSLGSFTTISAHPPAIVNKQRKILAQYAHHNGKGAVGSTHSRASPMPYPLRQYVGGQKVVAQYAHHDGKGAVNHPVY